jgi:AcrR family transcriptional regulator
MRDDRRGAVRSPRERRAATGPKRALRTLAPASAIFDTQCIEIDYTGAERLPAMQSTHKVSGHPGRPRCEVARGAILESTLDLLEESGFAALSIERVAARAKVAKTTVYRWWPNKGALVTDAFISSVDEQVRFPDDVPWQQAIRLQMLQLARVFAGRRGPVIAALLAGGQFDEEIIETLRTRWLLPRRQKARRLLENAIAAGELRDDLDPDVVLDALYGAMYFRLLFKYRPLTRRFIHDLCDSVLGSLPRGRVDAAGSSATPPFDRLRAIPRTASASRG